MRTKAVAGWMAGALIVGMSGAWALADTEAKTPLPRRGCLGLQVVGNGESVLVVGVSPDSPASHAGIAPMDEIIAVNGRAMPDASQMGYLRGLGEGENVVVTIRRGGDEREVQATLAAPRTTDLPSAFTEFGEAALTTGDRVRTIRTVPFQGDEGPKPAVLFVNHTDCSTVDPEVPTGSGWEDLIETLAQSGYITMRVEKPGVGDSEGPDCATLDFWGEVDVYRAALATLVADARVDPTRVFVIATRGGTTIAPFLARDADLAGVCAIGPVVRPWSEHLVAMMRQQSADWGMPAARAEKMLHDCGELVAHVVVLGEEPKNVAEAHPDLAPLVRSLGGDRIFGRTAAFHHQLNDADLATVWSVTETNVLVLRGEYDRTTAAEDQDLLARLVNGASGSKAWTATIPKTDTELNPQASADFFKTKWSAIQRGPNPELRDIVLDWLEFASAARNGSGTEDPFDPSLQAEADRGPGAPAAGS